MRVRSLPLLALVCAPLAIFRRREKQGFLGELEKIRGEALGVPGEVDVAMAGDGPHPTPEPGDHRPVAEPDLDTTAGAPVDGASGPGPTAPAEGRHGDGAADPPTTIEGTDASEASDHLPVPEADGPSDDLGAPAAAGSVAAAAPVPDRSGSQLSADAADGPTAGADRRAHPDPEAGGASEPGADSDRGAASEPGAGSDRGAGSDPRPGAGSDPGVGSEPSEPLQPAPFAPAPVAAEPVPPGPVPAVGAPGALAGPSMAGDVREVSGAGLGLAPAPAPPPAPNRERPTELWHAPLHMGLAPMPPEIAPEERVDPADLTEPPPGGAPATRRAFAPSRAPGTPALDAGAPAPPGLESFDDRLRTAREHRADPAAAAGRVEIPGDTAGPDDSSLDDPFPAVEVVSGRDLVDDGDGERPTPGGVRPAEPADPPGLPPRIKPPTDIFDLPSVVGHASDAPQAVPHVDGGLVGDPVGRSTSRNRSRRSLFGAGAVQADPTPVEEAVAPVGPDESWHPLEIDATGEVVDEEGVIRLAEETRTQVLRSASGVALEVDRGWCWIARVKAAVPVRVSLPTGSLIAPGGTRALVVVEPDRSAFVSVVSGSAELEDPAGTVLLEAGSIAHVRPDGLVAVDTASPDEMAADSLLTRNLRLDDAMERGTDDLLR